MKQLIADAWKGDTLEGLCRHVEIPAVSGSFDKNWEARGELLNALNEAVRWAKTQLPHAYFEVSSLPNCPPVLYMDIPAFGGHTGKSVLCYGHLDKQPETVGWDADLGPWKPVVKEGKLWGRGCVDDGYNFYSIVTAVKALEETKTAHPRITGLYETDEESGSRDMAKYIAQYKDRIGKPGMVCILDLFAVDDQRVWLTQSLRGIVALTVKVSVLKKASHSGTASGIVPSSFRIMRILLDRLENAETGEVLIPSMYSEIPEEYIQGAHKLAETFDPRQAFSYEGDTVSMKDSAFDAVIAGNWKPTLSVLGADGLPPPDKASGLVRTHTTLKLSFRIPPGVNAEQALADVKARLTTDIPYHASVTITDEHSAPGFAAPLMPDWLKASANELSQAIFGHDVGYTFTGGSIGVITDFAKAFPDAFFINTGALLPDSSAHAPNENLQLDYAEKLTLWVAELFARVPR